MTEQRLGYIRAEWLGDTTSLTCGRGERPTTMNALPLLDPKNDYVFKRLFSDAPELLTELINAVRQDQPPLEVVKVINPNILPKDLAGKFIFLDILAHDAHGRQYNIEMQVRCYLFWSARSTYYLARTLVQQLQGGQDYQVLKPVIGIHLLDFNLFTNPADKDQAVWCFEMRDAQRPEVKLGNELQLNLIELPKADRLGTVKNASQALMNWITFLKHWQEDEIMAEMHYPPAQQALERIRLLSADEETRYIAMARERALLDERSELAAARNEGFEKGEIKGEIKGKANLIGEQLAILFGPLSDEINTRLRKATLEQLDLWGKRILRAETIESVFADH